MLFDLSVAEHCNLMKVCAEGYDLVPSYDETSLDWALETVKRGLRGNEALFAKRVAGADGSSCGFFVVVVANRLATVVQIGAARSGLDLTLDELARFAWSAGCIAITGRLQREHLTTLAQSPLSIALGEPRFMVLAKHPELVEALTSGRAWVSRLDGEWGLGF